MVRCFDVIVNAHSLALPDATCYTPIGFIGDAIDSIIMKNPEGGHVPTENLPIEYLESSSLIGSDTLSEKHQNRIEQEINDGKKLDPVIVYNHRGANFIIEGNQRAGTYGKLHMPVPCVVIKSEEDFQKVRKMGIKIGNLEKFQTLKDVHSALADHMWEIRRDKYWEYFYEE